MKRASILLTLIAVMAFAPSAFACWKCDLINGCDRTPVGVGGWNDCYFDGACHRIGGFCQGLSEDTQLAASFTVAAVHVVEPETAKTPELTPETLPEPQKAELAVAER